MKEVADSGLSMRLDLVSPDLNWPVILWSDSSFLSLVPAERPLWDVKASFSHLFGGGCVLFVPCHLIVSVFPAELPAVGDTHQLTAILSLFIWLISRKLHFWLY